MPRRDFQRDIARACLPGAFPRLTDLRGGTEDGLISFTYTTPSTTKGIEIQVTVPDTSEYPSSHEYFAFTVTDKVPEGVPSFLEAAQPSFSGLSVDDFLAAISDCLDQATLGVGSEWYPPQQDSDWDNDEDEYEDEDDSVAPTDDEMDWELDNGLSTWPTATDNQSLEEHVRSDMRKAWDAGYQVSHLGECEGAVILTVACRISKLNISHEAMQAWRVFPTDFLVLLLRYPQGFRHLPEVIDRTSQGNILVQMHVGACEFYKPSVSSARDVFVTSGVGGSVNIMSDTTASDTCPPLKPIFIGKTLHSLLSERFIHILKCRLAYGYSWTGAELYVKDAQGRITNGHDSGDDKYYEPEKWDASYPTFLSADHLTEAKSASDMSLALIAMQFTLRRFVKCTEFCLNCYCKIDVGFEALKPFVCSNGLCLYQYLSLGMGPSLEWEISSQPYVVDLLISFAYSRAAFRKLEDFPMGLQLMIPNPERQNMKHSVNAASLYTDDKGVLCLQLKGIPKIKPGDWIVIMLPIQTAGFNPSFEIHARVCDLSNWPTVCLSNPAFRSPENKRVWSTNPYSGPVNLFVYDTNFDLVKDHEKHDALMALLDTLPDIMEMKSFIERGKAGSNQTLASWKDRISPAALYVLQWIVGSNRSCIMYEDDLQHQVSGMQGYTQFRLAQGAPDKEARFVTSVAAHTTRLKLRYPTLFAWHGSPLFNWHSILREGLHFKGIAHGRSYGNGVYMSPSFAISNGFSGSTSPAQEWPNSFLKCSTAISLNEVVNVPHEFVSQTPHYVVQHVDWIQPRYLFVKCRALAPYVGKSDTQEIPVIYTQDPSRTVQGPAGPVQIPMSAFRSRLSYSDAKNDASETPKLTTGKKLARFLSGKRGQSSHQIHEGVVDGADSTDSAGMLAEDLDFLLQSSYSSSKDQRPTLEMDFRPGGLQASSLRLLGQPAYANPPATKILNQQLRTMMNIQKTQPLRDLGWYIDPNLANNLYQWIVELHSFDPVLQLAHDLKKSGLTSVVLEIRFPPQFPLSPPFVRVIRPRFLRFALGGGGHITAGGSLCMELLTNSGWSAAASMESVLLQVRMAISNTHPQPARLDPHHWANDYTVAEAVSEYKRVCIQHGWSVPDDINELSWT